jgi:hypothetical protein
VLFLRPPDGLFVALPPLTERFALSDIEIWVSAVPLGSLHTIA